jgi:23S rRNA (uridine2479-2'-O)-methyltransferase
MNIIYIKSENDEFQIIQAIKLNREKRNRTGEVFIEGIESIKQALAAEIEFSRFITTNVGELSNWGKNLLQSNKIATIIEMKKDLYQKLCDKEQPSELIATARVRKYKLNDIDYGQLPFILMFDRPSDYGNFGSILRSANSFDVDAIFVLGHSIDIYDSKVIRSSLGSIFHMKIICIESMEELKQWIDNQKQKKAISIIGTDSTGEISILDKKIKKPVALILGNEAKGMSKSLKELCDYIIRIPISGNVNSLNVSCAGSIFLWEIYKNSD